MRVHLALSFVLAGLCCCRTGHAESKKAPRTAPAPQPTEIAWQQGIKQGWMDFGWSPRKPNPNGPSLHDLKGYGGWILVREQPMNAAQAGGLSFTYKAPEGFGDFLELRFDKPGTSGRDWEKIRPQPQHLRALGNGAFEVYIPMSELNPKKLAFDRIVFFAFKEVPSGWVAIDDVALTVPGTAEPAAVKPPDGKPQRLSIECGKVDHPISPLIYGIAFYPLWEFKSSRHWDLKPTTRRWGGNHTSRYNWLLGEAWNPGMDWFFRNLSYTGKPGYSWEDFLESNAQKRVESAIVLPMIGWVAKDTKSMGYPVRDYPDQQNVESSSGAGNGKNKEGKYLPPPPPTQTSVAAPPEFIAKWVKALRAKADKEKTRVTYILDNEPNLWDSTHHDLHPEPLTYDELWERTEKYAAAVKKADPQAIVQGPAEWGWSNYFYSQKDLKTGTTLRPDRRLHGDEPLIPWYLKKIAAYEKQTGTRLVDVLDLHFYPQANGVGIQEHGDTTLEASLRRIRSTRGLWDPTYKDESWIDDNVQLIPRMKKWVADHSPGMGTSIGEWNFGAEGHISGGLAVAEALGRFGQTGLTSAYYWTYPPEGSPAYWGFRAYRDYDGAGATFEDLSLRSSAPAGASLFASMSRDGTKIVAVILNLDPKSPLTADVSLDGCSASMGRRFSYKGEATGFTKAEAKEGAVTFEPFSINVMEWRVKKP